MMIECSPDKKTYWLLKMCWTQVFDDIKLSGLKKNRFLLIPGVWMDNMLPCSVIIVCQRPWCDESISQKKETSHRNEKGPWGLTKGLNKCPVLPDSL